MSSRRRRFNPPDPEFDFEAAAEAQEHALLRVEAHANPDWKASTNLAIDDVAARDEDFTTDDVWYLLQQRGIELPHERRAIGALMKIKMREGFIIPVQRHEISAMRVCHGRKKQVWRRA